MNNFCKIASMACMMGVLASCGGVKRPNANVWDLYDVRHPVPAHSAVPVSRAQNPYYTGRGGVVYQDNDAGYVAPYGTYQDNDAYYIPPQGGYNRGGDLCNDGAEIGIGCD